MLDCANFKVGQFKAIHFYIFSEKLISSEGRGRIFICYYSFSVRTANLFQGVRSPTLRLSVQNTSLSRVSLDVFKNLQRVQNISVDLFNNPQFQNLDNPSTGGKPGLSGKTFLTEISMGNNQWKCNCDLG